MATPLNALLPPASQQIYFTSYWHNSYAALRQFINMISSLKFEHACYPVRLHKHEILPSDTFEITSYFLFK